MAKWRVALDANSVTYLISALESYIAQPIGATAGEEIALCRVFFYYDAMYASPTVYGQCLAIPSPAKRENHES